MARDPQPPAGWYPDPSGAPRRRYWDGGTWTDQFAEVPVAGAVVPGADREADLRELRDGGRRAKVAVALAVPLYAVTPALQGQQVRDTRRAIADVREQLRQAETGQQVPGVPVQPYNPALGSTLASASSLPTIVIGVLFVIWFHRAATVALRLGRPARRTPGWAVGGWLIPIGNFFLPYQSAKDMFRSGERGRRVVKQWWAAYLVAVTVNLPLGVVVGFSDEVEVSIAAGALALVVWSLAAIKARELVDAANESLSAELC